MTAAVGRIEDEGRRGCGGLQARAAGQVDVLRRAAAGEGVRGGVDVRCLDDVGVAVVGVALLVGSDRGADVGLGRLVLGTLLVVQVQRDGDRDQDADDHDDNEQFDERESAVALGTLLTDLAELVVHGEPPGLCGDGGEHRGWGFPVGERQVSSAFRAGHGSLSQTRSGGAPDSPVEAALVAVV